MRLPLAAVAAGGALGALLRHWLGVAVPDGGGWPWTTLAVNVSGCLAIGLVGALPALTRRPLLAAAVGPGLLGGYTTMSACAEQTRALLADDRAVLGLGYLLLTLVACLAAVALGRAMAPR